MEQKWMANGAAVLVLDAGEGEPGEDGYRPALVARLDTEYHEPAQILDADPLAEDADTEAGDAGRYAGASREGRVSDAPQAIPGPATPGVTTRSTASEDPHVTAPGSAAAVGGVSAASIVATIRDLERRADAGDADAIAELDQLRDAFDADDAADDRGSFEADDAFGKDDPAATTRHDELGRDVTSTDDRPIGDRTEADHPETAPGGNGTDAGSAQNGPASATGAGDTPAGI
jgi:hypothetical protein